MYALSDTVNLTAEGNVTFVALGSFDIVRSFVFLGSFMATMLSVGISTAITWFLVHGWTERYAIPERYRDGVFIPDEPEEDEDENENQDDSDSDDDTKRAEKEDGVTSEHPKQT